MNDGCIEQIGTPEEIYKHSRTRFVCSFIGLTNIISAKVEGIRPERHRVTIRSGLGEDAVINFLDWQSGNFAVGDTLSFYIRPEDIVVSKNKLDFKADLENNVFTGKVLDCTFLGSINDFRIQVGEVNLRVQTNNSISYKRGEEILVYLDPEKCCLLLELACVY